MFEKKVGIKYVRKEARETPLQGSTAGSAGMDLRAWFDGESISIAPGEKASFPTGIVLEMERGMAGFVFSRSGLGIVEGLTVSQGVGVIDPDYRGEIIVSLLNTSQEVRSVSRGQRIAQIVFMPYFPVSLEVVETLTQTERGTGGFGHTGKN